MGFIIDFLIRVHFGEGPAPYSSSSPKMASVRTVEWSVFFLQSHWSLLYSNLVTSIPDLGFNLILRFQVST
jgi:hypothetical protein